PKSPLENFNKECDSNNKDDVICGWALNRWAAFFGRREVVETLLLGLPSISITLDDYKYAQLRAEEIGSRTPLHYAAESGYLEIVRLLLVKFRLDANSASLEKTTALHLAAENGHVEILLARDFDTQIDATDKFLRTPLYENSLPDNGAAMVPAP
ncbi:ankyrin repeat-containing domain protein, partial [Endogone sp. FLAS-F59071]